MIADDGGDDESDRVGTEEAAEEEEEGCVEEVEEIKEGEEEAEEAAVADSGTVSGGVGDAGDVEPGGGRGLARAAAARGAWREPGAIMAAGLVNILVGASNRGLGTVVNTMSGCTRMRDKINQL